MATHQHSGRVTAYLHDGTAVYHHGRHQTGEVIDVDHDTALTWLRHGWADYIIDHPNGGHP